MNKPLNIAFSIEIEERIKSKAKDYFHNAYKAALLIENAVYVQGFVALANRPYKPIEHSWLELDDSIVDPSWSHLNVNPGEIYYFPAQRLSIKQLKAAIEEAKEDYPEDDPLPVYGTQPYDYYGDVMLGGKEYSQAFEEASSKCRELRELNPEEAN
ncbi:MAG TPA: hypothetical protein V6D12_13310 [Candidatus Obscuribacterales bacterium]